jgi:hypothetical protein
MSITKTLIVSNAIAQLGHAPIQTLDNGDDMVVAAEQAYDMLLPAVLAENNWRFATQIQQLSLTVDTPVVNNWQYIYNLPADFLKTIRVYPQEYDWKIYENRKLYANYAGPFYMEYVFQPDTSRLPNSFVRYFCLEIASYIALSNAQRPDYAAVIDRKKTIALANAAAVDAQNNPQTSQINFPTIDQRNIAGFDYSLA